MSLFGLGKKKSTAAPARPAQSAEAVAAARGLPPARSLADHGDQTLAALLETSAARDWTALRTALEPYRGYDQSALIGNLCSLTPDIGEWVPADRGDALAQAVLGADAVERGWRVRSGLRAKYVSQDRFKEFHRLLRVAEEHLYTSIELDAGIVSPWYSLLVTSRGLQVEQDIRWRRFEALTDRAPGHLGGHRQMLQNLCQKWSGSHEQMHDFATAALRGEFGSQLGELVPDAHIERWLDLGDKTGGRTYMQQPEVRGQLQEAADLTVFRPGYACPRSPYWAANLFAMAFGLAGMWDQSVRAFEATAGVVAGRWTYMSGTEPEKFYTHWRAHVIQKANS